MNFQKCMSRIRIVEITQITILKHNRTTINLSGNLLLKLLNNQSLIINTLLNTIINTIIKINMLEI